MSFKSLFSKKWVKVLVIGLPVTLLYGGLCLLGLFVTGITSSGLSHINWIFLFPSLFGMLGIVGWWLTLLFDERLKKRVTLFNWIVAAFLLSGCAGVFVFLVFLLFGSGESIGVFLLFGLLPFLIALYGIRLIMDVLRPHREEKS